jgi:hypothetical protein
MDEIHIWFISHFTSYTRKKKKKKKEHEHYIIEMIYMLNGSVVLDLQPCSGDFGATIKPKGSRVTY